MRKFNHEIGTKFTCNHRKLLTFEIDSFEGELVWLFVNGLGISHMECWNSEEVKQLKLI